MNIEAAIQRFINNEILLGEERRDFDSDESLLSTGVLDSMALLRLVVFLEERFGVTVEDGELVPDNFETISLIKAFIERKSDESTNRVA